MARLAVLVLLVGGASCQNPAVRHPVPGKKPTPESPPAEPPATVPPVTGQPAPAPAAPPPAPVVPDAAPAAPVGTPIASDTAGGAAPTHTIYFVRHAQTQKNAKISDEEAKFSPAGEEQVKALTADLMQLGVRFDRIRISPLWRTQQTIAPFLAAGQALYQAGQVVTVPGLTECCWDAAHDKSAAVKAAAAALQAELAQAAAPQTVLIVGHYHSGRILLRELVGKDVELANAEINKFALPRAPVLPAGSAPVAACTDTPPDDAYSCEQQRAWGKCSASWMVAGAYCAKTCGRCPK